MTIPRIVVVVVVVVVGAYFAAAIVVAGSGKSLARTMKEKSLSIFFWEGTVEQWLTISGTRTRRSSRYNWAAREVVESNRQSQASKRLISSWLFGPRNGWKARLQQAYTPAAENFHLLSDPFYGTMRSIAVLVGPSSPLSQSFWRILFAAIPVMTIVANISDTGMEMFA